VDNGRLLSGLDNLRAHGKNSNVFKINGFGNFFFFSK